MCGAAVFAHQRVRFGIQQRHVFAGDLDGGGGYRRIDKHGQLGNPSLLGQNGQQIELSWVRRNFQIVIERIKLFQGCLRLYHAIQRRTFSRRRSALVPAFQAFAEASQDGVFSFLFLDVRGVRQHHGEQIAGGTGGMDAALEPPRHQPRQQAGVVDVGMCEEDEAIVAGSNANAWWFLARVSRPP